MRQASPPRNNGAIVAKQAANGRRHDCDVVLKLTRRGIEPVCTRSGLLVRASVASLLEDITKGEL